MEMARTRAGTQKMKKQRDEVSRIDVLQESNADEIRTTPLLHDP